MDRLFREAPSAKDLGGNMSIITSENPARPHNGYTGSQSPQKQGATGVILFTSTGQLLFMNTEAQAFTRQLQPLSTRECDTGLIPEQIHAVVHDLIGLLMHYDHPKDCESIQVERLCFANDQRLLLRGFCIPDEPLARKQQIPRYHGTAESAKARMPRRQHAATLSPNRTRANGHHLSHARVYQ